MVTQAEDEPRLAGMRLEQLASALGRLGVVPGLVERLQRLPCFGSETCDRVGRADPACMPNALPVRRWQARQLQIETANASPPTSRRSCPQ